MAITTIGGTINSTAVTSNLDYKYGPYSSKQEAYNTLGPNGLDKLSIGLTVGILEDGAIREYWFRNSISSVDDLVLKSEGKSAYDIAVEQGFEGTEQEWITSLNGESAYQIAVENGYTGTEQEWLESLKGEKGDDAINPFKGWYDNYSNLPENPVVGDYAYVKGAESTDSTAIYECTTAGSWSDSGRTVDTSNVQTFASGQEVNETYIVNDLTTGGANDVLSAEQGKVLRNSIFNANKYLSNNNNITFSDALLAAVSAGVPGNLPSIIYWRESNSVKIALYESNSPISFYQNTSYWTIFDAKRVNDLLPLLESESNEIKNSLIDKLFDSTVENISASQTISNSRVTDYAQIESNPLYKVSKFVIPSGTKIVKIKGRCAKQFFFPLLVAYDSNDKYLSKVFAEAEDVENLRVFLPEGTSYIYVNQYSNNDCYCKKEELTPKFITPEDLNDFKYENLIIETEIALSNGVSGDGFVISTSSVGSTISFGTFSNHTVFSIPSNNKVKVNIDNTGSYGFAITDNEDKILEIVSSNSNYSQYIFSAHNYPTKLYVSNSKYLSGFLLEPTELKDEVVELKNDIDDIEEQIENFSNENYWTNKTIWWCGTSIPAGSDSQLGMDETVAGNYPRQVGIDLNANVINKSKGSSMCRAFVRTGNYVGMNYANSTSRLSLTNAEAQYYIDNYNTIKGDLTGNPPDTLSSTTQTGLLNTTFESALLPYLNGTYPMPDLFVIDHGHNDYKYTLSDNSSDISLMPTVENIQNGILAEDTYMTANNNEKLESFFGSLANIPSSRKAEFIASVNRNCFIGSINFIITLILRYNPHARIVFISNYEFENGISPNYSVLIPAQKTLADSWAFPICEVYKYLGFSKHLIPGSMSWFNSTYPNQTPVNADITVFKSYCPDNVHPASDITGKANSVYAGIISSFLKNCR